MNRIYSQNRSFFDLIVSPIRRFRDEFETIYKLYYLYRARLTGQVAVLERHLNLTYDPIGFGIRIEDIEADNPIVIYRKSEYATNTVYLHRKTIGNSVYLHRKQLDNELNYLIVLPNTVLDCRNRNNLLKIIATINLFRCAGKIFGIKQHTQIWKSCETY